MDIIAISGSSAPQAAPAQAELQANADLFRSLVASALLQKNAPVVSDRSGEPAVPSDALAEAEDEQADTLGMIARFMLGGIAPAGMTPDPEISGSAAPTSDAVSETVARALPPETVGRLAGTTFGEGADIIAAKLEAAGAAPGRAAMAGDGMSNADAVETTVSNTEAARSEMSSSRETALKDLIVKAQNAVTGETTDATKVEKAEAEAVPARANETTRQTVRTDEVVPAGERPANETTRTAGAENVADEARTRTDAAHAATHGAGGESAALTAAQRSESGAESKGVIESPEPYSQVGKEILSALADKGRMTFSMQLEPAELGKIDVNMKMVGGKLTIDIAAESAKTQALLTGRADKLAEALGLHGIRVENVQVSDRSFDTSRSDASGTENRSDFAHRGGTGHGSGDHGARRDETSSGSARLAGVGVESDAETAHRLARRMDLTA